MQMTTKENWKKGDTFAVRINEGEYKDRYFVLIYLKTIPWIEGEPPSLVFRVKITEEKALPKTKEEIEKLEYIKLIAKNFITRFFPLSGGESYLECAERKKNINFDPDEINYLYVYKTIMCFRKKDYKKLIYLGNFGEFSEPKHEYHSDIEESEVEVTFFENMEEYFISSYEEYNLKKSIIYIPEEKERIDKEAQDFINFQIKLDKKMAEYFKHN